MKFLSRGIALFLTVAANAPISIHGFSILQPPSPQAPSLSSSFTSTTTQAFTSTNSKSFTFILSSSKDDDNFSNSGSRIEGNRREPTANEISIMDDMITKLVNAKPYELPNAVSKAIRVVSSPRFFLRIAERADMENSEDEKQKLMALAENLVTVLDAVVSTTEDKLDERAKDVEKILQAASEPVSGEFYVPLSQDRKEAMRLVMTTELDASDLDEGFLATVDSWMNKSMQDGMDGMVTILQKVLQIYAGMAIARARKTLAAEVSAAVSGQDVEVTAKLVDEAEQTGDRKSNAELLERILNMDTDLWDMELQKEFGNEDGGVTPQGILGEVQRTIEGVVLGLENGSMAQRVQAEFLRELVTRIEKYDTSRDL